MQKDFKIGLIVGVVFIMCVIFWLATRDSVSPEARLAESFNRYQQGSEPPENTTQAAVGRMTERHLDTPPVTRAAPQPQAAATIPDVNQLPPRWRPQDANPQTSASASALEKAPSATPREKIKTNRFHIVQPGQTLSEIAQKYYGSALQWPRIYKANRQLKDPDLIRPGMRLTIPE